MKDDVTLLTVQSQASGNSAQRQVGEGKNAVLFKTILSQVAQLLSIDSLYLML